MPDLDLDAAREAAGYDHMKLDGAKYRLLGDVPLGVSRKLQEATAAALATKKASLRSGRTEEEAETDANVTRGESITIDIFARLFHKADRAAVTEALDEITGEELGQLLKHVAEKKSQGLVPLADGLPSLPSVAPLPLTSNQHSLTPEAPLDSTTSTPDVLSPGLPANSEQPLTPEMTTRSVLASNA
jgi:hypothetical protein